MQLSCSVRRYSATNLRRGVNLRRWERWKACSRRIHRWPRSLRSDVRASSPRGIPGRRAFPGSAGSPQQQGSSTYLAGVSWSAWHFLFRLAISPGAVTGKLRARNARGRREGPFASRWTERSAGDSIFVGAFDSCKRGLPHPSDYSWRLVRLGSRSGEPRFFG